MILCKTCKHNIFFIRKNGSLIPYCERRNENIKYRTNCPVYIKYEGGMK